MSNPLIEAASEFLSRDTFNKGDYVEENRRGLALIQDPALAVRMADKKKALKALGIKKNPDQTNEEVVSDGGKTKDLNYHKAELLKTSNKISSIVRGGGRVPLNDPLGFKLRYHARQIQQIKKSQTNEEVELDEEMDELSYQRNKKKMAQRYADRHAKNAKMASDSGDSHNFEYHSRLHKAFQSDADDAKKEIQTLKPSKRINENVSVKKQNYSWGKMMTVHHGSMTSYPLHPEHQAKIKSLNDGEKTSFTDETKRSVTAHRVGDHVFLSGKGMNKSTPVPMRHFKEEVEDVLEGRWFRTAYGWAGGSRPGGGTYKHPEQIKADGEAKRKAKEKEKNKPQGVTKEEVESVSEGSGPLSSSDYMKGATRQDLAKGGSYQGKEIKSFHPNKEKEAREYAKKHGYVVKKKELPKGSGSAITHTWDMYKEGVELDEEKLSNWSFNDLHAHLKKNGWERDRNSKHIQYVHPVTKKTIAVPHKHGKTVAPGTVRNILQRMAEEYSDYGRALAKIRGRLKEEMEELEELKKSTLKSYVSKAAFDATQQGQQSMQRGKSDTETSKHVGKAVKRLSGIRSALRRM